MAYFWIHTCLHVFVRNVTEYLRYDATRADPGGPNLSGSSRASNSKSRTSTLPLQNPGSAPGIGLFPRS